jgi:hypothetical protein
VGCDGKLGGLEAAEPGWVGCVTLLEDGTYTAGAGERPAGAGGGGGGGGEPGSLVTLVGCGRDPAVGGLGAVGRLVLLGAVLPDGACATGGDRWATLGAAASVWLTGFETAAETVST